MISPEAKNFLNAINDLSKYEKIYLSRSLGYPLSVNNHAWFPFWHAFYCAYDENTDREIKMVCQLIACIAAMHKGEKVISVKEAFKKVKETYEDKGMSHIVEDRFCRLLRCEFDESGYIFKHFRSLFGEKILAEIDVEELFEDLLNWNSFDKYVQDKWAIKFWSTDEDWDEEDSKIFSEAFQLMAPK